MTYGDLVSIINVIGLELCTDIKLKNQLKKEQHSSRRELGSFCQDFGYTNIVAPSTHSSRKNKSYKSSKKTHHSKARRNFDVRPRNKSRFVRPSKSSKNKDVCWNCGKTGHRANECKSDKRKKKINLLEINEDTKKELFSILEEDNIDSSPYYSSDEYSDEEKIIVAYNSDSSQYGTEFYCLGAFCTCDNSPISIKVLCDRSKEVLYDVINTSMAMNQRNDI
ncbi:uncharacterized protein [Nicotiana tomentosiformis]|uniref:uncharacterized protein n=1 Tax=Nicotiana tomentosiformis TaxID=4098 RepID=UPI00388CDF03